MRTAMLVVTVLFVTTFFAISTNAAETKMSFTKEQVIDLVVKVYKAPANKFLLKSLDDPSGEGGFRVVFVYHDKRYTMDYKWWGEGVAVWVRPNGTTDNLSVDAFSDGNADGVVDFGTDRVRVFATKDYCYEGSKAEGAEYQAYWQEVYNIFLAALEVTIE